MLTMKPQCNLVDAKKYFEEHLCVGDYYMEGQSVSGQWFGKGAEDLGLTGMTQAEDFLRLCDNLHPRTGERLTQRQNTTRVEVDAEGKSHKATNRRVFFDFTLSPPKSVSIAALVGDDQRIIGAHDEAATAALRQLEFYAAARIRKKGQTAYRTTGNLVGAVFRHDTSRALDPHLHSHCIVFNATWDSAENCWKALEPREMLVAKKFGENVYYHELVRSLLQFGYSVRNNPRGDFDIEGVSPELVKRFSKRHEEIDRKTKELLEQHPDKAGQNINEIRANIAHKERARKIKNVGLIRLQSIWNDQLLPAEKTQIRQLGQNRPTVVDASAVTAEQAVVWAEDHLFSRRSVVQEHDIWRHALEHARGQNVSLSEIQAVTRRRDYVRDKRFAGDVTTRDVIAREWRIIGFAQDGIGRYEPLASNVHPADASLDPEQRHAVEHILSSRDFVTLFRGGAGTGKSYALREVHLALKQNGHSIQVLAPQRQQVADLEKDGIHGVQTVSTFLLRRSMPRNAVILVDEAGQIGGEQMLELLRLIKLNNGRVILSGDTRQHGAVEATDALRAIERYSGLQSVELTNIRRQNPAKARNQVERRWLKQYRLAVSEAQQGRLAQSFDRLDKQNAIVGCTLADQQEKLAEHYLELVQARCSTVVVSQSWSEIHKVNERVRNALKARGLIDERETVITALERLDLTDAQKRDERFYGPDAVLVFNRNTSGFKPGDSARLLGAMDKHLLVECNNRIRPVPFEDLDRVTVCQPKELPLSAGDRLQIKANAKSADGRRLANGELVTVSEIRADGQIVLNDGRVLSKDYRQFVRGYAVTSYAAQGKTVDYVLFSDSAVKAATNAQQWYVTISRGRKGVRIFTADKQQLRENITHGGERPLAMELQSAPSERPGYLSAIAARFGDDVAQSLGQDLTERTNELQRQRKTRLVQRTTQSQSKSRSMGI
jgi:conjugative relaxase-like TrwC/TraI family protein